jgi:hypothetical protein
MPRLRDIPALPDARRDQAVPTEKLHLKKSLGT